MATVMEHPDVNHQSPFAELNAILSERAFEFLQPTQQHQQAALKAATTILNPLAAAVADIQAERRTENRKKRKRHDDADEDPVLQFKQIYTQGFAVKQIWEQAKRVLDAASVEVQRGIEEHVTRQQQRDDEEGQFGSDEPDLDGYDSQNEELDELLSDSQQDEDEPDNESLEDDLDHDADKLEDEDEEDIEMNSDSGSISDAHEARLGRKETFIQDTHGLNDGFFAIDDFNKQTQFLEQMDARGDEDNPSDEDEVDWDADPLAMALPQGIVDSKVTNKKSSDNHDGQDDQDDSDDGPTFGNADLNAPDSESDDDDDMAMDGEEELDDAMGLSNANNIKYADFFEPPPKKPSKTKRMRALPKTQPEPKKIAAEQANADEIQNDIDRAMADVRRDLLESEDEDDFDDADEDDEEEGGNSDDTGNGLGPSRKATKAGDKNLSTHEKQRAVIAAEIRRLEAANVAKRDWQLSGEARAADRPVNSLIEEDFEFERAGKPIPVVTAETSEEIEQLIKRRILAREFDEVVRRHGTDALGSAGDTRRGRIELDDTKAQSGLGEIYEQEHLKKSDPAGYVDKRSTAMKKQHEQIDILWREINDQLNMLTNLHFKPKRVDIQMTTVEDKPRIAMEDARPVGDLEAGEGGMLAPQEVYRPGTDSRTPNDEVTISSKTGASVNREEMTREEKLRRRRREKERSKKAQTNRDQTVLGRRANNKNNGSSKLSTSASSSSAAAATTTNNNKKGKSSEKEREKDDIIADLKKGNVKVVGKEGQLQTLGKNKKGRGELQASATVGGNLKL